MRKYTSTGGQYPKNYESCTTPTTTNMTKNESFERDGYLFLPGLVKDLTNLQYNHVTDADGKRLTGTLNFVHGGKAYLDPVEHQVEGAFSRYNFPPYKNLHFTIRKEVEKHLGIDLLPTYFFERYYYVGHRLDRHSDRPSCEISVTLQLNTNSNKPWPIWFNKPDGTDGYVLMKNGDAVVYKGCEREHWRDPLESKYNRLQNKWRQFRKKEDDTCHHQIFLHYVNAQGQYVHHANDAIR